MAGHILQLQRERPADTTMYWVTEDGRRKMRRLKKTWRRTFKEDLEEMGVSWHGARRIASALDRWGFLVADAPRETGLSLRKTSDYVSPVFNLSQNQTQL